MNGGNGSPSSRPSWRASHSPAATVTAIAAKAAAGTRRAGAVIRRPSPGGRTSRGAPPSSRSRSGLPSSPHGASCRRRAAARPPAGLRLRVARRAPAGGRARLVAAPRRGARRGGSWASASSPRASSRIPAPGSSPSGSASPASSSWSRGRPGRSSGACRCRSRRGISGSTASAVLVPAEDADELLSVGIPGGSVTSAPTGREPHDAAAAGERVFVADEFAHRLTVLEDGEPVTTIGTALQPGGVTPLDEGRQVAVVSVRERVVETFDASTGERTGRAPAGVGPTHAVSDRRQLPVRHRHDRRRAARLPPAARARADPPLPAARLAVRDRDRQRAPPHVRHPDRAQPADRADGRRPPEPRRAATRRRSSRTRSRSTRRRDASSVTGKVDGVLQLLDPDRERTR